MDFESETFIAFSCKDHGADAGPLSPTLRPILARVVSLSAQCVEHVAGDAHRYLPARIRVASGMPHGAQAQAVAQSSSVRRLTPRECERLQGLPDDWTLVPYRGKPAEDGPRYKAIGNSMAVNCMRWIGRRIALAEQIQASEAAA